MPQMNDLILPEPGSPALARALSAALLRAGRFLAASTRALFEDWQRERLARATRRALQALDARTLRDLGLDRSEISGYPDATRRRVVDDPFLRSGG